MFATVCCQWSAYKEEDLWDLPLPKLLYMYEHASFYEQREDFGAFSTSFLLGSGLLGNSPKNQSHARPR